MPTATQQLTAAVLAWPGTSVALGARDEYAFRRDGAELGHLHADRVAHFGFPRDVGAALREAGRVGPHPVNPHSTKMAARALDAPEDVEDVLALLRLNYDRAAADDRAAIEALLAELDAAQSDPDRFCALVAEDVAVVNIAGRRVRGRAALHAAMTEALAHGMDRVTTRAELLDVVHPAADVALVEATKHVEDARGAAVATARGAYRLVLARAPAGWRVAALQTTPVA